MGEGYLQTRLGYRPTWNSQRNEPSIQWAFNTGTCVRRIVILETERLGQARNLPIDLYGRVLPHISLQGVRIAIGLLVERMRCRGPQAGSGGGPFCQ
jgi:hypothetical protein